MRIDSFLGALLLAMIHLFASRVHFPEAIPRNRWLSVAGGVAVAYALVHLLPQLQSYDDVLTRSLAGSRYAVIQEHNVWVLMLAGLVCFYGLESAARRSTSEDARMFWLQMSSYAIYNALLGYLLVREDRSVQSLLLFLIGIGLHFVVNDHSLRHRHQQRYHRIGRWVLAAAIFLGWTVGISTEVHEAIVASVTAFLAGGILLNTFKEELPQERESRFWAFAAGAAGYAAILLLI